MNTENKKLQKKTQRLYNFDSKAKASQMGFFPTETGDPTSTIVTTSTTHIWKG